MSRLPSERGAAGRCVGLQRPPAQPAAERAARSQVWMWGEPWGDFSMQVDRAPRKVPGAAGIAKIACGAFHNLALTRCPAALSPPRSGACLLPHVVRVGPTLNPLDPARAWAQSEVLGGGCTWHCWVSACSLY